ncbi:MAG: hypothetical protein IPL63_14045 [Saprospiraceae bacterium]|nr:hypothetical protein [Saprospiraceae bacterium]
MDAIGINNTQNYNTGSLTPGTYIFRRIYTISDPVCSDTSNTVEIVVKAKPSAGVDQNICSGVAPF